MTFIRDVQSLQSFDKRSVVTIGSFDWRAPGSSGYSQAG
jgi:hypothetical protein